MLSQEGSWKTFFIIICADASAWGFQENFAIPDTAFK